MKIRPIIINLFLAVTVLFAILFQSIDSIGHLKETFSKEICHHKYNSKSEFTHQHDSFEHCYVCQFSFSSVITPIKFSYIFYRENYKIPYYNPYTETVYLYSGSVYSDRGPPIS